MLRLIGFALPTAASIYFRKRAQCSCNTCEDMPRRISVTLVRHGETEYNLKHRLQGHIDNPLSDTGREQARSLGESIRDQTFHRAYTSDLTRAIETLHGITSELADFNPVIFTTDQRLRERAFGAAEGIPVKKFIDDAVAATGSTDRGHLYTPEGGETYESYVERIEEFLLELFHVADEGRDETVRIIIVTHGYVIMSIMRYFHENPDRFLLLNFDPEAAILAPRNTAVARFTIEPVLRGGSGKRLIAFETVNNYTHLRNPPDPGHSGTGQD